MRIVRQFVVLAALAAFAPALASAQDGGGQGQGQGGGSQGQGGGGGQGQGGRGRRGGGFGTPQPLATQLKDLGLTDEQKTKLERIDADQKAELDKLREQQGGGRRGRGGRGGRGADRNAMREETDRIRERTKEAIRGILTVEQKPKYEELAKKQAEEQAARRQGGRGGRGGAGGPGGGGRGRGPSVLDRAKTELTLTDEEKQAVMPLVQKVIDLQASAREAAQKDREALKAFLKGAPPAVTEEQKAVIAEKLKAIRKNREDEEARVKTAREALREVLTPENEAKMAGLGVLP